MKQLLMMCLTLFSTSMYAQTGKVIIKVKDTEVPSTVVESFKKDYGDIQAEEWSTVSSTFVEEEYTVSSHGVHKGDQPKIYVVKINTPYEKGEAVYDADGKLLHAKDVIKNIALPQPVLSTIETQYPGYVIEKDSEIVKIGKKQFSHYRVLIKKDKHVRTLSIDESGRILSARKYR